MTHATDPYARVITRRDDGDAYRLWAFEPDASELFRPLPLDAGASYPKDNSLVWIGNYFLEWGPAQDPRTPDPYFNYRLFSFDAQSTDPLAATALRSGKWAKKKFWGRGADFGNPDGGHQQFENDDDLRLLPLGSFLLNYIFTDGRGTFALWNFDPDPDSSAPDGDPVPGDYSYTSPGSFRSMQLGDQLIAFNDYVLDRKSDGRFAVWSFDPQSVIPLAHPPTSEGRWPEIGPERRLDAIGDYLLDWDPSDRGYRLWTFDPHADDPLVGPVREGQLPEGFDAHARLLPFAPVVTAETQPEAEPQPGSIEFMRAKIEHVVYYMLENRSLDHALGWLYEDAPQGVTYVGPDGPWDGAKTEYFNLDGDRPVHLSKFHEGKLSVDYLLEMFTWDPYHDCSDVLRQLFFERRDGYSRREVPDMGGFVWNNGSPDVMQTYSREQLPVLNGLARNFAASDRWFCSMPSGTDVNRAFSLTGSAMGELNNFMSPPQYDYWPEQPHRASIWKQLWANGIRDWKIYNATTWIGHVFTYQLYLQGQIPSVDAAYKAGSNDHIAGIDQFFADAAAGNLPKFSYLEPVWIGTNGTTSYHPGEDIVPGERQLNAIYDALRKGPNWDKTLLIVTFDEHGGIFDHVPPPYAQNPWPNDVIDGFRYDIMGPRVPTILASPWIESQTIFRAPGSTPFDATSFLATLLQWFGVPASRWFLGDRIKHAPTFESVFTRASAREDSPGFTPPWDKQFPPDAEGTPSTTVHGLHRLVATRAIMDLMHGKAPISSIRDTIAEILEGGRDLPTLKSLIEDLRDKFADG